MKTTAPVNTIMKDLQKMGPQIAAVLPRHITAERMMRVARTALQTTRGLAECDPRSIMACLIETSQLGLEPNDARGQAYLIPFNNKHTGRKECQIIIGYRGLMDLAWRSNRIESFQAEVVYTKDLFEYELGLEPKLKHRPAADNRGAPAYAYAVARLKGGAYQFVVLSRADIDKARASSQSANGQYSPWNLYPDEMWKKTAIRRLAKMLPLSVEFAQAIALEDAATAGAPQTLAVDVYPESAEVAAVESSLAAAKSRVQAMKAEPAEPKYSCGECNAVLPSMGELEAHKARNHSGPPRKERHVCPEPDCDFESESVAGVKRHHTRMHGKTGAEHLPPAVDTSGEPAAKRAPLEPSSYHATTGEALYHCPHGGGCASVKERTIEEIEHHIQTMHNGDWGLTRAEAAT